MSQLGWYINLRYSPPLRGAKWGKKIFMLNPLILAGAGSLFYLTMLKPLILTGLTPKSPILPLHMLIWYHETLYGDKKEKMSTHEHTWARMSKNAKSADSSRFNIEIPYFGPPHAYLTSWDPLWWQKRACELTWASMSKMSKHELNAKSADFNGFNTKIP